MLIEIKEIWNHLLSDVEILLPQLIEIIML